MVKVVDLATSLLQPLDGVLDLGCGYGWVSPSFTSRGNKYTGIDVSKVAVTQARKRNPAADFVVADLSSWMAPQRYDLVVALYVFVHFVDDAAWRDILTRSLTWVKPGGAFLFADIFPAERESKSAHYIARPIAEYAPFFDVFGFKIDENFSKYLIDTPVIGPYATQFRLARSV